ncbi:MAG: amino acid aminotransferase [Pseudomonadota bacterium]
MFDALDTLAPDPILGLMAAYRADPHPQKIDLGVGIYKDEAGDTPIMAAAGEAERQRIAQETTKAYIGPPGTPEFNDAIRGLIFGNQHDAVKAGLVTGVQTPGGCGALRVTAELLKRARPQLTIWVSDPTWANHIPLLGSAGLNIETYAYYDRENQCLRPEAMLETLAKVATGDVVLLHGCCHNPSGVDLDAEHWHEVAKLANQQGFLPFIDLAYQGLGDGLDEDAYGARYLAEHCEELVVAGSCSKNFGLYRERVGTVQVKSATNAISEVVQSQLGNVVRGIYSMPPAHGAAIVERILGDEAMSASWRRELDEMRERINGLRALLAQSLSEKTGQDFSFIERQRGMFSFLGITPEQVATLKEQYSIYMVDSSRINVAGINQKNVKYFVDAVGSVLA